MFKILQIKILYLESSVDLMLIMRTFWHNSKSKKTFYQQHFWKRFVIKITVCPLVNIIDKS